MARTHHTTEVKAEQALRLVNELWEQEVVPHLPTDLAEQAKQHKAFERQRAVANAYDLLRGILGYALGGLSTRQWGAWAVLIGLADISERAWSKRLAKSGGWLLWLFGELTVIESGVQEQLPAVAKRVLLIDATTVKQVGGTGDDWRLHSAYDLVGGRLSQVKITDRSEGEKLSHFELEADDIVVADNGYGYRATVARLKAQHAEGVFRIHPNSFPLEDEWGQALELWSGLRRRKGPQIWEQQAYCRHGQRRYRLRVIACRVPPQQAGLARKRAQKRAKKKGRVVSLKSLVLAGWLLLITTLDESWSATDILRLYRVRWQIELLFKRIKQMLNLHQIRLKRPDMVQATLRALLVGWALQEAQAAAIQARLQQLVRSAWSQPLQELPARPTSHWLVTKLCLQTVRHQVLGVWSLARLRACLPRLLRFLTTKRRKRGHQHTDLPHWLLSRFFHQPQSTLSAA